MLDIVVHDVEPLQAILAPIHELVSRLELLIGRREADQVSTSAALNAVDDRSGLHTSTVANSRAGLSFRRFDSPQDPVTGETGQQRPGEYPDLGTVGEQRVVEGETRNEQGDGEADSGQESEPPHVLPGSSPR